MRVNALPLEKLIWIVCFAVQIVMTTQYIPAGLWDSLQEICFRKDQQFIQDVSRILGIPAGELKRKILGTRGVPTVIPEATGPWWLSTACPIMEQTGYLWRRCMCPIESNGACWAHREGGVRFDDAQFVDMPKRVPFRYQGEIYWVAEDGTVLNSIGMRCEEFTVDLKTRTVVISNARSSAAE